MVASNTVECMQQFIGEKVVGVLTDTFPLERADLARGTKTLVFGNGTALTFSNNGSYWSESADDVRRAVRKLRHHLQSLQSHSDLLALAGE